MRAVPRRVRHDAATADVDCHPRVGDAQVRAARAAIVRVALTVRSEVTPGLPSLGRNCSRIAFRTEVRMATGGNGSVEIDTDDGSPRSRSPAVSRRDCSCRLRGRRAPISIANQTSSRPISEPFQPHRCWSSRSHAPVGGAGPARSTTMLRPPTAPGRSSRPRQVGPKQVGIQHAATTGEPHGARPACDPRHMMTSLDKGSECTHN